MAVMPSVNNRMHAETLREVARSNYRLQDIQFHRRPVGLRWTGSLTLSGTTHLPPPLAERAKAGPQAPSLPVVIGAGSHPFPFRTRKLSLLPPMVLHGKLCGRVGRCRHYFHEARRDESRRAVFVPQLSTHRWQTWRP